MRVVLRVSILVSSQLHADHRVLLAWREIAFDGAANVLRTYVIIGGMPYELPAAVRPTQIAVPDQNDRLSAPSDRARRSDFATLFAR